MLYKLTGRLTQWEKTTTVILVSYRRGTKAYLTLVIYSQSKLKFDQKHSMLIIFFVENMRGVLKVFKK